MFQLGPGTLFILVVGALYSIGNESTPSLLSKLILSGNTIVNKIQGAKIPVKQMKNKWQVVGVKLKLASFYTLFAKKSWTIEIAPCKSL